MTIQPQPNAHIEHGTVCDLPLNRLKKSPRNARRTPHGPDAIEALAASIATKGMLQALVVEPEFADDGAFTGSYLVTIGEGRRQAQMLRVKRKEIKKTELIRCVIDTAHDAHEISLDENVTRSAMHPADQFEAFQRLATERSMGPEEIGARFGVTATVVRQRLKLASVDERLLEAYRAEALTLDQLMAFAVTDDQSRQWELWTSLQSWERTPQAIRRRLTEDRVRGSDRRAVFVGSETYGEAEGVIERDLFAEDHGGYFRDGALLDRLAVEKLADIAAGLEAEGWRWAEASLDAPPSYRFGRLYPVERDFTEEEQPRFNALLAEQEAMEAIDDWTDEQEERHEAIAAELRGLEDGRSIYTDEQKAMSGVLVSLGPDGQPRLQLGMVRPGDALDEAEPDMEVDQTADGSTDPSNADDVPADTPLARLSDAVVADLTAHRSAALRHRLIEEPAIAFTTLLHAMVLRTFNIRTGERSCLDVRLGSVNLETYAPSLAVSRACEAIRASHEAWEARLARAESVGAFVESLEPGEGFALLAHCTALTLSEVHTRAQPAHHDTPADRLAERLTLDMRAYWTPTAETYFGRVTKAHILDAVTEAVSEDAARRIAAAKKPDMAEAAEALIVPTSWLPEPLRTHDAGTGVDDSVAASSPSEADDTAQAA